MISTFDLNRRQPRGAVPSAILCVSLTLLLLCTAVGAGAQAYAPQFSVQALDGGSITNSSLSGRVVLLQFWATWCQYCRGDQPAVDQVERDFADKGLTVLAVDVGEPAETVRAYLQRNPRSCRIALDSRRSMAAQFGAHAFPHYVLLDRNGKIAGTLHGAAGEDALRQLIARSKVFSNTEKLSASYKAGATPVGRSSVIDVALAPKAGPAKPLPKTVFFFLNGEQLEADRYLLRPGVLELTVNGEPRQIPLDTLDLKKTTSANHERGIDFKVPAANNEVFLSF
jgi:thiol-disulfide isomerase/thioredoxin